MSQTNVHVVIALLILSFGTCSEWGYDEGETDWTIEYPECGGSHQSPIDIQIDNSTTCNQPIELVWHSSQRHFAIRNNGHSLQAFAFDVDQEPGGEVSGLSVLNHVNDTDIILNNAWYNTYTSPVNEKYCFDSMHFHWGKTSESGSEHTINGKHFPLELHLVHFSCDYYKSSVAQSAYSSGNLEETYDDDNILAVISVLFEISSEGNPVLEDILNDIVVAGVTEHNTPEQRLGTHLIELYYSDFDLMGLLPNNKEIIGYEGSLTTPPCYETVRWNILKNTMNVSEEQMGRFRKLLESTNITDFIASNYRPTKLLNNRVIYECQDQLDKMSVEKKETKTDDTSDTTTVNDIWFIIGIVFVALFGVAILVIMYLAYLNYYVHDKKDDKERKEYEKVSDTAV
eukprot:31127_1